MLKLIDSEAIVVEWEQEKEASFRHFKPRWAMYEVGNLINLISIKMIKFLSPITQDEYQAIAIIKKD